jgi:hypothetical protein
METGKKSNTRVYVEKERKWNRKYIMIPVIIGGTGILTKGLK